VGQQPGPGVRHDPSAIGSDRDPRPRGCSLHLESASQSGPTRSSANPVFPGQEALFAIPASTRRPAHEEPGLAPGVAEWVPAAGLFILIGAEPFTEWLPEPVSRDHWGYLLTGQ